MKTTTTLVLLFTTFFTLIGQHSNLIKIGASYGNTNYLVKTGNQKISLQLGYEYQLSDKLALSTNIGYNTNHWEYDYSVPLSESESNYYADLGILFPILVRWIPSGQLRAGGAYTLSWNNHNYSEEVIIQNNQIAIDKENSHAFLLHKVGLMLEYNHSISGGFRIFARSSFNVSLNQIPAYSSTVFVHHQSGGVSKHKSSFDQTNGVYYQLALGVGYSF